MSYETLAKTALKLIQRAGVAFTLTRGTDQIGTGKCVVQSKTSEKASNTTASYKKEILLPGTFAEPKVGDKISTQGETRQITKVAAVKPALVVILYKVECE